MQRVGVGVYGVSFLMGIGTTCYPALKQRGPVFKPGVLVAGILFVFLLTQFFIWLEFTTQCITGFPALMVGAVLCG